VSRKGRIEKVSLKAKDTYELEFAIDTESELKALNILADVFGENIKQIPLSEFAKRDSLVFITHHFTIEELSDDNYRKLLGKKMILIIKDELSVERAAKLLEICIPVETTLKRLLIYVWSEISIVLNGGNDKKTKIEICSQINRQYLGDLLKQLEMDLSFRRREDLFANNGDLLSKIINESEDFADFKKKIAPYATPITVWECINIMLKSPTEYSYISGQLNKLKELRDMAAHHHVILQKDLKNAKDYSIHILSKITNVRNDYYEEFAKSIQDFAKVLNESLSESLKNISTITKSFSNTINSSITLKNVIPEIIEASQIKTSTNVLRETLKKIDWSTINNEMRSNDPEMKNILERFDNNDVNSVIKEMQKEIDEGTNSSN
jgi:hypothetical protein